MGLCSRIWITLQNVYWGASPPAESYPRWPLQSPPKSWHQYCKSWTAIWKVSLNCLSLPLFQILEHMNGVDGSHHLLIVPKHEGHSKLKYTISAELSYLFSKLSSPSLQNLCNQIQIKHLLNPNSVLGDKFAVCWSESGVLKKHMARAQEGIYGWTRLNSGLKIQLVGKQWVSILRSLIWVFNLCQSSAVDGSCFVALYRGSHGFAQLGRVQY